MNPLAVWLKCIVIPLTGSRTLELSIILDSHLCNRDHGSPRNWPVQRERALADIPLCVRAGAAMNGVAGSSAGRRRAYNAEVNCILGSVHFVSRRNLLRCVEPHCAARMVRPGARDLAKRGYPMASSLRRPRPKLGGSRIRRRHSGDCLPAWRGVVAGVDHYSPMPPFSSHTVVSEQREIHKIA